MAYVMIYYTIRDSLALLSREEKGDLFDAILAYAEDGDEPNLTGAAGVAFNFLRHQIDRDKAAYIDRCEINRENGMKGGRPRKDGKPKNRSVISVMKSETKKTQYKDKSEDKDEEKEKDNDHDKDKTLVRDAVMAYAQDNLQYMSYGNLEELVAFKNDLPDDVIMYAIDTATGNGKRMWSYVRRILARWADEGIKSIGEVKAQEQRWQRNSVRGEDGKRMQNPALNYQHGGIDYEALDKLGQDFWKE